MSLRSFTHASMLHERTARKTSSAVKCRSNERRGRWIEKLVFPTSYSRENEPAECKTSQHTYMIHRSPATASSYKGNVGAMQLRKVHFFPRILVSTYNNARPIAVDEQERFMVWFLLEQPATVFSAVLYEKKGWRVPILKSEVEIRVTRLRDVDAVFCG